MPQIPTSFNCYAYSISLDLSLLLRATRSLSLAKSELRWLKLHALKTAHLHRLKPQQHPQRPLSLRQLCVARARGKPLQYLLGSQPFGEVEVLCRAGVLIPRPETETYTLHLASKLSAHIRNATSTNQERQCLHQLRVLDLCAGSGCISLALLAALRELISEGALYVHAVDNSPVTRTTALKTVHLNQALGRLPSLSEGAFEYVLGDVLRAEIGINNQDASSKDEVFDVVIANPPYISAPSFDRDTARSARCWEPRAALVPRAPTSPSLCFSRTLRKEPTARDTPVKAELGAEHNTKQETGPSEVGGEATGDIFYAPILAIASRVRAKVVLMEVADIAQAERVLRIVEEREETGQEKWAKAVWCDHLGLSRPRQTENTGYVIVGGGGARAVVLGRDWGENLVRG